MPISWRRWLWAVALIAGAVVLVLALWEGLQLAAQDEQRGFMPQATSLRAIVVAEAIALAVGIALDVWLIKRRTLRMTILTLGIWAIALVDLWFEALAGTIPA
jgi:hypothetical protein